jgi:leucyl aminopeptidase
MNYIIKDIIECPTIISNNSCYVIPYIKDSDLNDIWIKKLNIKVMNKDFEVIHNSCSPTYFIYNVDSNNFFKQTKKKLSDIYNKIAEDKTIKEVYNLICPGFEDIQTILLKLTTYKYKGFIKITESKDIFPVHFNNINISLVKQNLRLGKIHSYCRYLQNTPSNIKTPEWLANKIIRTIEKNKLPIDYKLYDDQWIYENNMGGLIAVSKGSVNKPRFLLLNYNYSKTKYDDVKNFNDYICLVGKGITFDSGGINIKGNSDRMHMDMSGVSTCVGIIMASAFLKLQKNILCVLPMCENMPSGSAYKQNDIIIHYDGTSSVIDNTDAEGRIILADGVSFANKLSPKIICDFCTLTGLANAFTGSFGSILISNDNELMKKYENESKYYDEKILCIPIWNELKEFLHSEVADIRNASYESGGDTMMAMWYIYYFVKNPNIKYMHFDLADTIDSANLSHINGSGKSSVVLPFIKLLQNI